MKETKKTSPPVQKVDIYKLYNVPDNGKQRSAISISVNITTMASIDIVNL